MSRHLAAILVADVVGYSRLMGMDEAGTFAAIQSRYQEIVTPIVGEHGGRVVKFMGDGVLAEFPSAVNAVIAARALQDQFAKANEPLADDNRILLRIGVNLGDVISEGSDIFGDGVNIAARLETLADPGGICISAKVHEELAGKLEISVDDLGEIPLKNIAKPVRAFKLRRGSESPARSEAKMTTEPLNAQPSIAVLPFANMSADPEQEYFSDGITEDIITDLSKIAGLLVIARNSSFAYKNKNPDIRTVGRELGVRSVLEGSIRRAGNRVRITAQLIDAGSGGHLWAERFDRDLTDIFEVQDEVTQRIVEALEVALRPTERALLKESRKVNIEAHDCFLRGRELLLSAKKNRELFDQMVASFERTIELDPGYAEAYAGFAMAYALDFQNHWSDTPDPLALAARFVAQAIEKGPNESYVHYVASVVAMWQKDLSQSKAEAEAALALNANFARAYGVLGLVEVYLGSPLAAIPYIERARRLDPVMTQQYLHFLGSAYLVAGQYEAAAATFRERIRLAPETDLSRALLVSALGHLGAFDDAQRVWQELQKINPKYSFAEHLARLPLQNPADIERIREGLMRTGVLDEMKAGAHIPT